MTETEIVNRALEKLRGGESELVWPKEPEDEGDPVFAEMLAMKIAYELLTTREKR